jgi:tetratricopeptide (TPR) repeat protein
MHVELARGHLEQGRRQAAFAEYVAALLIDPTDANAYMGLGQLHLAAGRNAEAVRALERLVALHPEYVEARHVLGTALMRAGRSEDGARELAAFARMQAAAAEGRRRTMAVAVLREEALLRASEGDVDRAATLWRKAIEAEPDVAAHHASLGAVLADSGRPVDALPHLERAAALGGPPDVYRRLAAIYTQLGRQEDSAAARARYERVVLAAPRARP